MITVKTLNETVMNIINNIHDALPEVDTKEGTFMRDVIINPVASEFANIYDNLYKMELSQSVLTATGSDLDKLASNYFIQRKSGTSSFGKVRFYIANTNRDHLDYVYPDVKIPKNTIVATYGTIDNPSIQFVTINDVIIKGTSKQSRVGDVTISNGILGLPRDATGYRYIEIECQSMDTGSKTNIAPHAIVSLISPVLDYIYKVSNPYSFNGGSDAEDDISLALRVGLAITGSNIGTKDGYLSYVLQQPQVLDAVVIGAQDPFMERDYIKIINDDGTIEEGHMGGKVDIYVRTNTTSQDDFSYTVQNEDIKQSAFEKKIYFPEKAYPIQSIVNISGERIINNVPYYTSYRNADDYELERVSPDNTTYSPKYYVDILWDFSIKNYFPDAQYNPLPPNLPETEIIRLKTKLDNELSIAMKKIRNLSYKIEWNLMEFVNGNEDENKPDSTTLFDYYRYTDGLYYKLVIKSSSSDSNMLSGRMFVMKENKMYVRVIVNPDFKIVRDTGNFMGSVKSRDYIQWFKQGSSSSKINIPTAGEKLVIKYINNTGIRELQEGMEVKRVLTADVLIKSAHQKNIEIKLDVICSKSYDSTEMFTTIGNALSYYINNNKNLGGYLDESDIVYIVKSIDGVLSVDIDTVELNYIHEQNEEVIPSKTIKCNPNQYFFLSNLVLNISNKGIV